MKRLSKLLHLSLSELRLLVETAIWLIVARMVILNVPFRLIAPLLGKHMVELPVKDEPEHRETLEQVSWAVQTACRNSPWECTCLVQAIAAKSLLKRHGAQSTLYLGVAKDGEKNLKAHAWLRSGNVIVIGAQGMNQFKVVSTFAEKRP
jgi:hypothetical protein